MVQEKDMLLRWLSLSQQGNHYIKAWLVRNNYKRVAVFSSVEAEKRFENTLIKSSEEMLIEELTASDVHFTVVISSKKNILEKYGEKTTIIRCVDFDFKQVDCIIVPDIEILSSARNECSQTLPIIGLNKIINDIFLYEVKQKLIETLVNLHKRGVNVLVMRSPIMQEIKEKSIFEKMYTSYIKEGFYQNTKKLYNDIEELGGFDKKYESKEFYIENILPNVGIVMKKNYKIAANKLSKYKNAGSGIRYTIDTPEKYTRICHLFGDSILFANYLEDSETIPSHLQRLINERISDENIMCKNYGVGGMNFFEICNRINDTRIQNNDIVIVEKAYGAFTDDFIYSLHENKIPYYDCQSDFQRPHDMGEVFIDIGHPNWAGNKKIAEILFDKIFVNPINLPKPDMFQHYYRDITDTPAYIEPLEYWEYKISDRHGFKKYIENIKMHSFGDDGKSGAIVMNCNPFTLGHHYLIETAAKKVDYLYIFIVEENLSEFTFDDRIELVRQGTADLSNVKVLSGGRFIISNITFPEYFIKGESPDITINPSMDVELFAEHIAPSLNITIRFAGEEPLDKITKQYNDTMRKILPEYNIEFVEIPRKESNGEVISASRVRRLLKDKDFDEIAKIVPDLTLIYLEQKFGGAITQK